MPRNILNIKNHADRAVTHWSIPPAWRDGAGARGVVVSPQSPPRKPTYSPDLSDFPATHGHDSINQSIKMYSLQNTKPHYRVNIL